MGELQALSPPSSPPPRVSPPTIAILPSPGMGHLIPLVQLAKRLVREHGFRVTFLTFDDASPSALSFLCSLPPGMSTTFLPAPSLDDLPPGTKIETVIALTVARSLPALRALLAGLQASGTDLVALVADLFGTDAFDAAAELGIAPYLFCSSTATSLNLLLHLPELDSATRCEFPNLPGKLQLPGCLPFRGVDLPDPFQDQSDPAYHWLLHNCRRYGLAEGILVNSCEALESGPNKALREQRPGRPPVYAVGPLVDTNDGSGSAGSDESGRCLRWLDEQPEASVVYVSFGSGGTLSGAQLMELAWGLEASQQRFLWVVRTPSDTVTNAAFFKGSKGDPLRYLPEGFVERTEGRGLAVPSWAPQAAVLRHRSCGGFVTHCGWNSVMEAVTGGVPMVAWPLYAEQHMNAVMLVEGVGMAVRARGTERRGGIVGREEVRRVVTALMGVGGEEGKVLRRRVRKVQEGATAALKEGGPSTAALSEVVSKWRGKSAAATTTTAQI